MTAQVALSFFSTESRSFQTLGVAIIHVETNAGSLIPISALIVPTIAAPLHNSCHLPLDDLPYLQGLRLANSVTADQDFIVSILIGTDYYWSFVQDHIVRGEGPTA